MALFSKKKYGPDDLKVSFTLILDDLATMKKVEKAIKHLDIAEVRQAFGMQNCRELGHGSCFDKKAAAICTRAASIPCHVPADEVLFPQFRTDADFEFYSEGVLILDYGNSKAHVGLVQDTDLDTRVNVKIRVPNHEDFTGVYSTMDNRIIPLFEVQALYENPWLLHMNYDMDIEKAPIFAEFLRRNESNFREVANRHRRLRMRGTGRGFKPVG